MSDPRLPKLYADADLIAGKIREVAEAHVQVTPPGDPLSFILVVATPGAVTGMHTFILDDGSADIPAAVEALAHMARHWLETGGGVEIDRAVSDIIREVFGSW